MTGDTIFNQIAAARPLPHPDQRAHLRRALGIKQLDVAAAVGVSTQTVWAWENGRSKPRGEHRQRYAELLAAMQERLGRVD